MTFHRRLLALLAALLLLAAACGDDDGDGDTVESEGTAPVTTEADGGDDNGEDDAASAAVFERDACELLTDEQVASWLGDGASSESTPGDVATSTPASCTWSAADGAVDLLDPALAGITVFHGDEQIFDNTRVLAEDGDDYEELDLGDDAYVGAGVGGVRVGEAGITVSPLGTDLNDPATHDLVVDFLEAIVENA